MVLAAQVATPAARGEGAANPDADMRIVETVRPRFPSSLQRLGVATGEVRLMLEVDPNGDLTDCLITLFTRKEFAYEARKAVDAWRFVPARIGGAAVSSVTPLTIVFQSNGALAVVRQTEALSRGDLHYDYAPCPARDLDHAPEVLKRVSPVYSSQLRDEGVRGRVLLDFYIDETGTVRFPIAREPVDPRLAGLAVQALKGWVFEKPTRGGVPMLARASTSFAFDPLQE